MKNLANFYFFFVVSFIMNAQTSTLFVGTYTNGDSNGVYTFEFDSKTGQLSNKKLIVEETNPSYLTFTKNKKFLYVINEVNSYEGENGSVSTYLLNSNGVYQKVNTVSTHGAHPCHISLNDSETKIAISNYSGGNVSLHEIKNGLIQPAFQVFDQNSIDQKAHAHMAQFKGNQLFTADLGRNFVAEYTENKGMNYHNSHIYDMIKDAGPRHFRFSNDGNFIYVINELNSTISILKKSDKGYTRVQNVNTLPQEYSGHNQCADLQISADEQYVYGSNRGHNSIAVFKRDIETGRLNKVQTISVQGDWPRSFIIDPTGSFLLVANERSNNISVFNIDKSTGKLKFLSKLEMSAPVCLLF